MVSPISNFIFQPNWAKLNSSVIEKMATKNWDPLWSNSNNSNLILNIPFHSNLLKIIYIIIGRGGEASQGRGWKEGQGGWREKETSRRSRNEETRNDASTKRKATSCRSSK